MRLDVMAGGLPLRTVQELAGDIAEAGLDGLVLTESGRTAYLSCAAASLAADIDVLTGIAVAFPRSPMVTASTAWELAEVSQGRFRLGLGTQIRAHVERRYGVAFEPPGPRMRDYLLAVRACFAAFRGDEPLDHHGPYHELTLLPPAWSPGDLDVGEPPVDLAAVNPWMLRLAGELADGVHVHPLNTRTYLERTVVPELTAGAAKAGRSVEDLEIIVPAFLVMGNDEDERRRWLEGARMQLAFYGSTPNYSFIFEQLGREGVTELLRQRQREGDLPGMAAVIDDELLDAFVVTGTTESIADAILERFGGIATRVVDYFGAAAWGRDRASLARWAPIAAALRAAS